jgi:predicted secreted protein
MAKDQNEGNNGLPDLSVGEVFTVSRENNRSTGYEWRLVYLDKFALLDVEFRYESEIHAKGAPGKTTWVLEALAEGQGVIQFAKFRPFEPTHLLYDQRLPYTIGPWHPAYGPGPVVPPNEALAQEPGGWSKFEPVTKGSDAANIFEKTRPALGVHYKPLLYSQQVVNGDNYLFLADAEIVGGQRWYAVSLRAFVKDGNVTRMGIKNIGQPTGIGTYDDFVAYKQDSPAGKTLASVFARRVGFAFTPLYVAQQKVAGTNYLCAGNGYEAVLNPTNRPLLIKVYQPPEGPADIVNIEDAFEL